MPLLAGPLGRPRPLRLALLMLAGLGKHRQQHHPLARCQPVADPHLTAVQVKPQLADLPPRWRAYGSPNVSARSASKSAIASTFAYCSSGSESSHDRTSGSSSISYHPGIPPSVYTTAGMRTSGLRTCCDAIAGHALGGKALNAIQSPMAAIISLLTWALLSASAKSMKHSRLVRSYPLATHRMMPVT